MEEDKWKIHQHQKNVIFEFESEFMEVDMHITFEYFAMPSNVISKKIKLPRDVLKAGLYSILAEHS